MVDCNTYLPKNPAHLTSWTDHLLQAWSRQEEEWTAFCQVLTQEIRDLPPDPQSQIDQIWHKVCRFLEEFLLQAAGSSPVEMKTTKKPHRNKDEAPRFRRVPPVLHQRYDQYSPTQVRLLRKLIGRLREIAFRTHHGQNLADDDPVWKKIQKSPWWHEGVSVDDLEAHVERIDAASKNANLNAWRPNLRNCPREVFKWLCAKPQNVTNDLINGVNCWSGGLSRTESSRSLGQNSVILEQRLVSPCSACGTAAWGLCLSVWDRPKARNGIWQPFYLRPQSCSCPTCKSWVTGWVGRIRTCSPPLQYLAKPAHCFAKTWRGAHVAIFLVLGATNASM